MQIYIYSFFLCFDGIVLTLEGEYNRFFENLDTFNHLTLNNSNCVNWI